MRRLVVALIAAAVALTLVGCGSSAPPATTTPAAAPAPAPAPGAAPVPTTLGLSDNEPDVFSAFPTDTAVPAALADDIIAKQPTLLYFYDSSQNTSKENRKIVNTVLDENRGLVDLFAYDIGKHFVGSAADTVTVDSSFAKDATFQSSVSLARLLGVSETPFMVLTDKQGYIVWKFRGFVDHDTLERQVLRASN
jgi:hypothetical protein